MSNDNSPELPDDAVIITSAKVKKAHADFIQAKADEKQAKERKAQAEQLLREALAKAGKQIGFIGKTKAFSLVASKTTSFDREMLETMFPEAFQATLRTTEYDYIRTA
jgi:hypothetical protein